MDDQVCKVRRGFLKAGMALALTGLSARPAFPAYAPNVKYDAKPVRELNFFNLHTGESLKTAYWADGDYLSQGLADINYILRDFRNDHVSPIAVPLLDLLHQLRGTLDTSKPFQIISGYRSPKTNSMLRSHSKGVAKNSQHLLGKAIDLRVQGVALNDLRRAAISLHGGGVGYYPSSNFVHVDVGRVRTW